MRLTGNIRNSARKGNGLLSCLLFVLSLTLSSCNFRPLIDPAYSVNIRIEIDTTDMKNINTGIYNRNVPIPELEEEVMHVVFYDQKKGNLVTEVYISDRETAPNGNVIISGDAMIGSGSYRMVGYNFGTMSTIIKDYNSWDNIKAHTGPVDDNIIHEYRSKVPEEEIVTYEPDHLFLTNNADEIIPFHEDVWQINAVAKPILDTYYLQIKVKGLEYVSSAHAFLSSMASGNMLSENERIIDPQNTIYFSLMKSEDDGVPVICNIFNTFGHIDGLDNKLVVTFDVRTKDGRSSQHSFDITDIFKTEDAVERNWLLIDETIVIDPPENPVTGGGGMAPSVEDWDNEKYEIFL